MVAKLVETVPRNIGYRLFFSNCFPRLGLIHYLDKGGILSVGTIQSNCLNRRPLIANKDLQNSQEVHLIIKCKTVKWLNGMIIVLFS